ncbi:hypothetical protein QR680_007122 [Steinernema hermaphroditum]|uniref:Uncharacterized protein n=1 Tax=Steinernema hermaphroditum TaxID=289476 RepID=A0AA39HXN7_9BILA|nr:hypothetical protein QR680_007122 [Steinernema hermaphroditum]
MQQHSKNTRESPLGVGGKDQRFNLLPTFDVPVIHVQGSGYLRKRLSHSHPSHKHRSINPEIVTEKTLISDGRNNILLRTSHRFDLKVGDYHSGQTYNQSRIKVKGTQVVLDLDHNSCEIYRSSEPLAADDQV